MRQTHVAGEKLFVDFAGDTVAVIDPLTGEIRPAHIFVAALGASNFAYAEARWSEGLADWISVHVDALTAIGGVPKAVVCDNLKAGVTKPSRYEPGINRSYQELATHYGFAVLPTRIKKRATRRAFHTAPHSAGAPACRCARARPAPGRSCREGACADGHHQQLKMHQGLHR